jgi:sugar lactone lactonase YvrE
MKMKMTKIAILATTALTLSTPLYAAGGIQFKAPSVYPEGTAYNSKTGEFYVSSMRQGTIGAVKADGHYRPFAKDALLVSAVGMHADPERGRLLVCVSDPGVSVKTSPKTQKKIARLVAFDLKSGKRIKSVDLNPLFEGQHFCNDMAVDGAGNVYVTDSFSPVIYRVDPSYKASVFATSDSFKGEGFNLNGIVYHKDGYLLVDKSSDGSIWKIDVKDPKQMSPVALSAKVPNADGLVLLDDGALIVIQNQDHKVSRLKSTDGWKTAKIDKSVSTDNDFPTTGVVADGKLYVLLSRLGELFADPAKAKSESFTLTEVTFP